MHHTFNMNQQSIYAFYIGNTIKTMQGIPKRVLHFLLMLIDKRQIWRTYAGQPEQSAYEHNYSTAKAVNVSRSFTRHFQISSL